LDITKQYHEQQEAKRLHVRITSFLGDFKVGTLLNQNAVRKMRGVKLLELFTVIFLLSFHGVNFKQGIVGNPALDFQKDAAYDFLKNPKHNGAKVHV